MHITPEVRLQALVEPLSLSIGLWVVSCAATKRNICKLEQLRPKMTGENAVAVRDDRAWKAMQSVNSVKRKIWPRPQL
jgi:hypothetical protein